MTITMEDLASDVGKAAPKKVKKPKKTEGADRALVASVKEELRALIKATVDKGIDEAGALLLKRFFGDEHGRYGGKNPENPSLNLLLKQCGKHELHLSRTFIGNALRLTVFGRSVKKGSAFSQLSPSHRIELLCLGDPTATAVADAVEALSEESLANGYSVRQLRQVVEDFRGLAKRRKPVDRTLASCVKATTDDETGELAFTAKDFAEMTLEQAAHAKEQALVLMKRAEAMAALATARLTQLASAPPAEAPEPTEPKVEPAKVEKKARKAAKPVATEPPVKEPAAAANAAPAGKPAAAKPSRRRDDAKASPEVAKVEGRAAADEPAVKSAVEPNEVSRTSETTTEADAKAATEPRARETVKTAT